MSHRRRTEEKESRFYIIDNIYGGEFSPWEAPLNISLELIR